jgi:hypothetical protein
MPCRTISLLDQMIGADLGGTWTYLGYNASFPGAPGVGGSTVGTLTGDNPEVDFEGFTPGKYHFEYCVGEAECELCETLIVSVKAQGTAGTGSETTFCESATSTLTLASYVTGETTGGQWAVSGGSPDDPGANFNAGAGTLNLTGIGAGVYQMDYIIDVEGDGNFDPITCLSCRSIATVTITVVEACDPGEDASSTVTSTTGAINLFALLGGSPDVDGEWTQVSGTTASITNGYLGTVNLNALAGCEFVFEYECPGPSGCQSTATVTIIKNAAFDIDITLTGDLFESDVDGCDGTTTYQWQRLIAGIWTNIGGATSATYTATVEGLYRLVASCDGCALISKVVEYTLNCECNNLALAFEFDPGADCLTILETGAACSDTTTDVIQYRENGTGTWNTYSAPLCGCNIRQYLDVTPSCSANSASIIIGFSAAAWCTGSGISVDAVYLLFGNNTIENNFGSFGSGFNEIISKNDFINLYNRRVEMVVRLNMGGGNYLFQRVEFYYTGTTASGQGCAQLVTTVLNYPKKIKTIQARRQVTYDDGCPPTEFTDTYSVTNCDNAFVLLQEVNIGGTPGVGATVFNCPSATFVWYRNGSLLAGVTTQNIGIAANGGDGLFEVVVSCTGGCGGSAALNTNACLTTVTLAGPSSGIYTATVNGCVGSRTWYWEKFIAGVWTLQQTATNSSSTNSFTPSSGGQYRIRVVCNDGCGSVVPFMVDNPCTGLTASISSDGTTLTATGGGGTVSSYQWQRWNGSSWVNVGTNSNTYTPTQTGLYKVIITFTNGCTAEDQEPFEFNCTVDVSVSGPVAGVYTGTITNCSGSKTWIWEKWDGSSWDVEQSTTNSSSSNTFNPDSSGDYRLTVICGANNCSDNVLFSHVEGGGCVANVEILPSGSFIVANVTGCTGTILYLWYWRATPGSGSWGSPISTTNTILPSTYGAGEFKVEISCTGCTDEDTYIYSGCTTTVTVNCASDNPYTAVPSPGGGTYQWQYSLTGTGWSSLGTASTQMPVNGTGWYRVIYSPGGGCPPVNSAACYYEADCDVEATIEELDDKCDWNLKTLTGSTTSVQFYHGGSNVVSGSWNMGNSGDRTSFKNAIEAWLSSNGHGGNVTILHDSKGDTTIRVNCTKSAPERVIFIGPDANTSGTNITAWFGKCGRECDYEFTLPSVLVQGIYIGEHLFLPALNPYTSESAFISAFNTFMSANGYSGTIDIDAGNGVIVITTTAAVGACNTPSNTPIWKSADRSGCGSPTRIYPTLTLGFTGCVGTQTITWQYRPDAGSAWTNVQSGGLTYSTCASGQFRAIGTCGDCPFTTNTITI